MKSKLNKALEKVEELLELGGVTKNIVLIVLSAICLVVDMLGLELPFAFSWVAIVLCGLPIVCEAVIGLIKSFDIRADVLVSIALIASICIGEYFAAGEVAFIMQLGALLEDLTVSRARDGIEKLVKLSPTTARKIDGDKESVIEADKVQKGDILRVLPGEIIAVDGVIVSGTTSINQAVMTGESLPIDKVVGDEVQSGTINTFGAFDMKATKVGEDSSIQRMIKLVQSADASKAKIVHLADKWATWVVVVALLASLLTGLLTGEIIRAVTVLVVFCPCSLVLATPTAIMAAIGNVTKHGFLVREGDALERLSKVKIVTFDKTGTLTYGVPKVCEIKTQSEFSTDYIYKMCASVEKLSEHPIGKAIVRCYKGETLECSNFWTNVGEGVEGDVDGRHVTIKKGDSNRAEGLGATVVDVLLDGQYVGFIALSDTIRETSKDMILQLKKQKLRPVLLTGDSENPANAIAQLAEIDEIHSGLLPYEKLEFIAYKQRAVHPVCMIGDGINDAPALKKADVGIAMAKSGSDIAIDAADIALVDDNIAELPHIFALSKRMMKVIKINLTFSMLLNFVAIILAMTAVLNPVLGALVHNAGSVLVIINSALLLTWKKK